MTISHIQPAKNFTDLIAWQEGYHLVLGVYRYTRVFPRDEQFALTNQMRRAAVSITSNLAEGFGRRSLAEKKQFYTISSGSLAELQSQLRISIDLGYLSTENGNSLLEQTGSVYRLINRLISSITP